MRKIYLLLALIVPFSWLNAQVTLDIADFPVTGLNLDVILFNPGYPGLEDSVVLGAAGAAGSYDFTAIDSFVLDTTIRRYNNPDTFGWAADHPTANYTVFEGIDFDTITGTDTIQKTYYHYHSQTGGIEYVGGTYILDLAYLGGFGVSSLSDTLHPVHTITDTIVDTAWGLGYSRMDSSYWQGIIASTPVLVTHTEWNNKTYNVDGEGTLVTATGSYPVLRVKITDVLTVVDSTGPVEDSRDIQTTRTYQYWAKGVGWAICELDMNASWDSIWFGELVYIAPPVATEADLEANQLSVYPNPTSGKVNIKVGDNRFTKVRLVNLIGQVMLEKEWAIGTNEMEINLDEFTRGVYFIMMEKDNGDQVTSRVLKQ